MTNYKCYKCDYEWVKRKDKPKACPRCKARLDYVFKEPGQPQPDIEIKNGDNNKMPEV